MAGPLGLPISADVLYFTFQEVSAVVRIIKLCSMGILLAIGIVFGFAIRHPWQWVVCLALLFSWLGDALLAHFEPLTRKMSDPFIAGMGAFALAQISYIIAFNLSIRAMPTLHKPTPGMYLGADVLGLILPVYILFGLLFWMLIVLRSPRTWDLKIAALVYCCLLCTMGGFAASAAFTGTAVIWQLIAGGILFIVSDGIIAARVFGDRFENERRYDMLVWATYLPAQILLLIGTGRLY